MKAMSVNLPNNAQQKWLNILTAFQTVSYSKSEPAGFQRINVSGMTLLQSWAAEILYFGLARKIWGTLILFTLIIIISSDTVLNNA